MEQGQKCDMCGKNSFVPAWDENIEIPLVMYHYNGQWLCQTCRINKGIDHAVEGDVKQSVQKRKRKVEG